MGYPMALNLRRKIPKSFTLVILELNKEVIQRFVEETKEMGKVIVAKTPREVAERSVNIPPSKLCRFNAEHCVTA